MFAINAIGSVTNCRISDSGNTINKEWNCDGLKIRTWYYGTVNKSNDKDNMWSVEIGIPFSALSDGGRNPLDAKEWKANFVRTEWSADKTSSSKWIWSPVENGALKASAEWGCLRLCD